MTAKDRKLCNCISVIRNPSLPRPVKELKGFKKVKLAPGEEKRNYLHHR
ncbi:MAG: fibronectin type III-like domain-contianing protein [Bacteroides cellulosilyticus]